MYREHSCNESKNILSINRYALEYLNICTTILNKFTAIETQLHQFIIQENHSEIL